MVRKTIISSKGTTALELLIGISAVTVLAAFASSSMSNGSAKAALNQAVDIMNSCVVDARNTARLFKADVEMRVQKDEWEIQHSMIVSIPSRQSDEMVDFEQKCSFPAGVLLAGPIETISINARGSVEIPTQVRFVSNEANGLSEVLLID